MIPNHRRLTVALRLHSDLTCCVLTCHPASSVRFCRINENCLLSVGQGEVLKPVSTVANLEHMRDLCARARGLKRGADSRAFGETTVEGVI
jgi:hypothetical protein